MKGIVFNHFSLVQIHSLKGRALILSHRDGQNHAILATSTEFSRNAHCQNFLCQNVEIRCNLLKKQILSNL